MSTLVRAIQSRNLVKLGGRTPSNTVYSRLSQDARFVNVSRGAYALATVVSGGGTAASTPTKFSARDAAGGGAAAAGRLARTNAVDSDEGHGEDDVGSVHGDDANENESPMESEAAAVGGARAAAVAAASASAGDPLGCSSRLREVGAAAARGGRGERRQRGGHGGGTQRGILMGLRSGVRRVSA